MEEDTLNLHLHKLSSTIAESGSNEASTLEHVFETLWQTRNTGLRSLQKSYIQSLLNLPSLQELDPVLACLRSLIRKTVHGNYTGDDIQKLFPIDLPPELQSILLMLLQKYQNQWKEEASMDQPQWQRTRVTHPVKVTPFSASETSSSMWPRQDDVTHHFSHNDLGAAPTPIIADPNMPRMGPASFQRDDGPTDDSKAEKGETCLKRVPSMQAILPRLKSMTWTMENRNSTPSNRVAIINFKLQDYTKSPSRETEVKFQLSRDTLEAMLRSMTYINQQLSNNMIKFLGSSSSLLSSKPYNTIPSKAGTASGPVPKKQRQ